MIPDLLRAEGGQLGIPESDKQPVMSEKKQKTKTAYYYLLTRKERKKEKKN